MLFRSNYKIHFLHSILGMVSYTLPASLAGLPAMSVPAGFGAGGLPVGLQLIGNYLQEGRLLNVAHRFQQATDFHLQTPAGF